MSCRLAISGEGYDIKRLPLGMPEAQHLLERCPHFIPGGTMGRGTMVGIKSALAVYAVKGAHLSIGRHKINAQRYSKPAGVDRSEDW